MRCPLLAAVALSLSSLSVGQVAPVSRPVPVVVELFTSEGCSSCPPADSLLAKLANEPSVPGVEVVTLGMHVTYWDRLGWKDPASLDLATARQQSYSRVFGEDRVYTPQAVVDGQQELVGSDQSGVLRAIEKAGKQPHARLVMTAVLVGAALDAQVTIAELPPDVKERLDVKLVLTEGRLTSIVKRGENSGRTLQHEAVVRAVLDAKVVADQPIAFRVKLRPEWRADRMRAVAVLQGTKTLRIWGAATTPLG
jgi:hypothetical protein